MSMAASRGDYNHGMSTFYRRHSEACCPSFRLSQTIFFTFLVTRCLALTLLPHATATTNPRVLNSRTISLSQATHTIKVGKSRYMIEPREVVAELGDYIEWQFWSGTHQISRGDFDHPCSPYEDFHPDGQGFSSGEKLVEAPR
ncbi:hypothetical protein V2G26_021144 [Clonostachys chloroleuca]